MPELTEFQVDWIQKSSASKVDQAAVDRAARIQTARDDVLNEYVGLRLAGLKDQIASAQDFTVTQHAARRKHLLDTRWKKIRAKVQRSKKTLKWHESDASLGRFGWDTLADLEVDTVEDVPGIDPIPEEVLDALADSFARILEIQDQMLNEIDEDGNRLFSDEDITRELWTPLVREGTIPENMVPDRFSQQTQAFKGAADLYQARIEEYSAASTGKEGMLKVLSVGADTLSLVGTIFSQSVTIHQASDLSSINEQITTEKTSDGTPLDSDQIDKLKEERSRLQNVQKFTDLGVTIATGGFELGVEAVKEKSKGKDADWVGYVDKTLQVLSKVASAAVDPIAAAKVGHENYGPGTDAGKAAKNAAALISAGIQTSISGIRMGPAVIAAVREDDPQKRRQLIDSVIDRFADSVGNVFTIIAAKQIDDNEKKGRMTIVGAAVSSAIKTLGRGDLVLKALDEGRPGEAAIRLGSGAIEATLSSCSEVIIDAVRKDVDAPTFDQASVIGRMFMQDVDSSTTELTQDQLAASMVASVNQQMETMQDAAIGLLDASRPEIKDEAAEEFAAELGQQLDEQTQLEAEAKLTEYFGNSENIDNMFATFDEKLVGFEQLYEDAIPDLQLAGRPPDQVERALDAIDQAIARTSEIRARAEMINSITATGAGVVATFLPGAGAVGAAQKVAYDIYVLSQAVQMHNKWCDSMEIAFRASSAYGPAIEKTMRNARITLSRASVKLVLDSVKLGSEVGRCFDPTGATTIVSAATSITSALVDWGYKMHSVIEIELGWSAYVSARENPGNRKRARAALRMNSTLAKCCIAYGACMADDPAAKEAVRRCGLSPSQLADSTDVCKRLVTWLENELSGDPLVLQVEKLPKKWQPGRPELSLSSWFSIKAAAASSAEPRLSMDSAKTPGIDRLLGELSSDLWQKKTSYAAWRKAHSTGNSVADIGARAGNATRSIAVLKRLQTMMENYQPKDATPLGSTHDDMVDIAKTYFALARLNIIEAEKDLG